MHAYIGGIARATGMSRTKYLHLLEDPEVKRWYQNVVRGSRITADVYLRRLGWPPALIVVGEA